MELSKEHIHFIDTYLENSDIAHVDIRFEMIDHVASEIESQIENGDGRDFYFIFKDYMIAHKSSLLSNNKQFLRAADRKILKSLSKAVCSWQSLLTFLLFFTLLQVLKTGFEPSHLISWIAALPLIGFVVYALTYLFAFKFLKYKRFSAIERIAFLGNGCFQLFHIVWLYSKRYVEYENFILVSVVVSISMTLLMALIRVTRNMIRYYQKTFKGFAHT